MTDEAEPVTVAEAQRDVLQRLDRDAAAAAFNPTAGADRHQSLFQRTAAAGIDREIDGDAVQLQKWDPCARASHRCHTQYATRPRKRRKIGKTMIVIAAVMRAVSFQKPSGGACPSNGSRTISMK